MKTVTFCGHSDLSAEETKKIRERLHTEIENLIRQGATEFLLGGYGGFDRMCATVVLALKEKYPHILSVLVIPYLNREYNEELYDCSEYPPLETVPKRFAIVKRNEYMIQRADAVVSYVKHGWGGAAKTLEYAQRKKKHIIMISDD